MGRQSDGPDLIRHDRRPYIVPGFAGVEHVLSEERWVRPSLQPQDSRRDVHRAEPWIGGGEIFDWLVSLAIRGHRSQRSDWDQFEIKSMSVSGSSSWVRWHELLIGFQHLLRGLRRVDIVVAGVEHHETRLMPEDGLLDVVVHVGKL